MSHRSRLQLSQCNLAVGALVLLISSGCSTIGPRTVSGDHLSFNNAVSNSSNEQLLLNIVRLHFGKPMYRVEIESMISEYKLAATGGFSDQHNDLHGSFGPALAAVFKTADPPPPNSAHTTKLRGSARYSQKPTIVYRPLEGQESTEDMLLPISHSNLAYLTASGWGIDRIMACCVQQINEFCNQYWVDSREVQADTGFLRLIALFRILYERGEMRLSVETEGSAPATFVNLPAASADLGSELSEVKTMLNCPTDKAVRLRVTFNSMQPSPDGIVVRTRSVLAAMNDLAWEGVEGRNGEGESPGDAVEPWLCVKRSILPRKDALVQVQFEGHWYYILKEDWKSKRTFAMISSLQTLQATSKSKIPAQVSEGM